MAKFNYQTREIIAKIVYYGPSFGGKTRSLQWLHKKLDPRNIGKLFTLDTEADRTLFFDLLPINILAGGMAVRLKVYTVPGQVKYNATRKMVLTGADAVIFVADSDITRHKENVESFNNLLANMAEKSVNVRAVPLVFQYNKRDVANVMPLEIMDQKLNPKGFPAFGTVAIDPQDRGVLDGFIATVNALVKSFDQKYHLAKENEPLTNIIAQIEHSLRAQVRFAS